jgi:phosphoribosylformylglycinamidine synthase
VVHGLVAGRPPALDLELEGDVQRAVRTAVQRGMLASAHDCSEGGIAVALAECCIAGDIGAVVALDDGLSPVSSLFSETQSRILVSLAEDRVAPFLDLLADAELPYSVIGEVGGTTLEIEGKISLSLEEIANIYSNSLEQQVSQR